MEQIPLFPMDMLASYRICVLGSVGSDYAERFWGMKPSLVEKSGEPEQTMLVGKVADQAALVGIINTLYNGGYTLILVERILPDTELHLDNTDKEY